MIANDLSTDHWADIFLYSSVIPNFDNNAAEFNSCENYFLCNKIESNSQFPKDPLFLNFKGSNLITYGHLVKMQHFSIINCQHVYRNVTPKVQK